MNNLKSDLSIEAVKKFLENSLKKYSLKYDKDEKIPMEFISSISERGYLGLNISKKYGGLEADEISIGLINKEFAKYSPSVRSIFTVQGMISKIIAAWGNEEQRNKWLPLLAKGSCIGGFALAEEESGSDSQAIESVAIKCKGGYLLSGKKVWVTMGQIANIFIVFCKYNGLPGALIVERNREIKVQKVSNLSGLRSTMVAELYFDNTFVPEENLIASWGVGLNQVAFSALEYGRYTVAWGCVGIAEQSIYLACKYANDRIQFHRKIKDNQLIKKMISEMITEYKASYALCMEAGKSRGKKSPESIVETWIAKYHASKMVNKVVPKAAQILGASSCMANNLIEMFFRDIRMFEIIEGTSQMHELFIADWYL